MSQVRPLRYTERLGGNHPSGSWEKQYGVSRYYTHNGEFLILRDEDGQWRCIPEYGLEYIYPNNPVFKAFRDSGMEAARFRYRREVVEALEQLYESAQ